MIRLRYYIEGRLLEWTNSVAFGALGICVLVWPKTATNPAFQLFAWVLPTAIIGLVLIACGFSCIAALVANGSSKVFGPRVRAWTALLRSMLLFQFGLSTLQSSVAQGFPFTVVPFWFLMALAEIWVVYRAVLDVRSDH